MTPPREISPDLLDRYTMGGRVKVEPLWRDDSKSEPTVYDVFDISRAKRMIVEGHYGRYGKVDSWLAQSLLAHPLDHKKTAVIGSADQGFGPWYEVFCLLNGASVPITAIDNNRVEYRGHEAWMKWMSPADAPSASFDAVVSISTFEHSGLGRYGDPLDPDGDLKAMDEAARILNPGGLLYLAVPLGLDKLVWNAHRIYGRARLPLLLKGWDVVARYGYEDALLDRDTGKGWDERANPPEYSPVWVMQKAKLAS